MQAYLCASIPILRVESNDMDSTCVQNGMCRRFPQECTWRNEILVLPVHSFPERGMLLDAVMELIICKKQNK